MTNPNPTAAPETCGNCRFWDEHGQRSHGTRFQGTTQIWHMPCRRMPAHTPRMFDDWCGEWAAKHVRGDKLVWARGLERIPLAVRDLEYVTVASWGLPDAPLAVTLKEVAGYFPMGLFDPYRQKAEAPEPEADPVAMLAEYLIALHDWMLTHDHDMSLPDGILDTNPLDLAESLEGFRLVRDLSEEERRELAAKFLDEWCGGKLPGPCIRAAIDAVLGPVKGNGGLAHRSRPAGDRSRG